MNFAARVRDFRSRNGLTQAALADDLGVDISTVSRWERGIIEPGIADFSRINSIIQDPVEAVTLSPVIASAIDADALVFLAVSVAAAEIRGVTQSEVIGTPYSPFIDEKTGDQVLDACRLIIGQSVDIRRPISASHDITAVCTMHRHYDKRLLVVEGKRVLRNGAGPRT